jgi:hypothetical protein
VVPRSRFAPVKTCNDLLVLRSDCYTIAEDATVVATVPKVGQQGSRRLLDLPMAGGEVACVAHYQAQRTLAMHGSGIADRGT